MLITFTDNLLCMTRFGVCDLKLARNIWRMFCYITTVDRPVTVSEKVWNIIISFQQAIDYRVKVSGETLFAWLSKHPSTPPPIALWDSDIFYCVGVPYTNWLCVRNLYHYTKHLPHSYQYYSCFDISLKSKSWVHFICSICLWRRKLNFFIGIKINRKQIFKKCVQWRFMIEKFLCYVINVQFGVFASWFTLFNIPYMYFGLSIFLPRVTLGVVSTCQLRR